MCLTIHFPRAMLWLPCVYIWRHHKNSLPGNGNTWTSSLEGTWLRGAVNFCSSLSARFCSCWFCISTWLRGWWTSALRTGTCWKTMRISSRLQIHITWRNTISPSGIWSGLWILKSKGMMWSCSSTSRRPAAPRSGGTWSRMSGWRFRATVDRDRRSVPVTDPIGKRPGSSLGSPPVGVVAYTRTGPNWPTAYRGFWTKRRTGWKTKGDACADLFCLKC